MYIMIIWKDAESAVKHVDQSVELSTDNIHSVFTVKVHHIASTLKQALSGGFGLAQIEFFSPAGLEIKIQDVSIDISENKSKRRL